MSYSGEFNRLAASIGGLAMSAKGIAQAEEKEEAAKENMQMELNDTQTELESMNKDIDALQKEADSVTTDEKGRLRNKGQFYSQKAFESLQDELKSKTAIRDRVQYKFDVLSKRVGGTK